MCSLGERSCAVFGRESGARAWLIYPSKRGTSFVVAGLPALRRGGGGKKGRTPGATRLGHRTLQTQFVPPFLSGYWVKRTASGPRPLFLYSTFNRRSLPFRVSFFLLQSMVFFLSLHACMDGCVHRPQTTQTFDMYRATIICVRIFLQRYRQPGDILEMCRLIVPFCFRPRYSVVRPVPPM